ncbi:Small secreted domain [Streptomyces sp. WMMB 714]|jgi:hypothetical protein|uniref:chaplin family protein n=1 Tax=Streptomyces sp. WMMB 714 TaxID=1286822 RepID=UPI0005F7D819|nr:chaplin family protein [Streptomyces sp. WMMB 714]SCK41163.1 Small secreted domain [Streptomyces sp. WMMB 714]
MIKKVAAVAAAAGGLMLAGAGVAVADGAQVASGGGGVASGNNVQVPVDVPIELCGNTISVLGDMNRSACV